MISAALDNAIVFYTDGSADPKRGRGSWAFVRVAGDQILSEASGSARKTDSARMEITAAIEALSTLSVEPIESAPTGAKSPVIVYTDCKMLIEAMTELVPVWRANDWRKPKHESQVPYADLYKQLDELATVHSVSWRWIRAHNGNVFNERCDELCRAAGNLKKKEGEFASGQLA